MNITEFELKYKEYILQFEGETGKKAILDNKLTKQFKKWFKQKRKIEKAYSMISQGIIGVEYLKTLKRACGVKNLKDVTALSPLADPFRATKVDREKAEWFLDVWEKEGSLNIHPRGLHYRILGKYTYKLRDNQGNHIGDREYENTSQSWHHLLNTCKWARYFQLVDYDVIKDMKNPRPLKNYYLNDLIYNELDLDVVIYDVEDGVNDYYGLSTNFYDDINDFMDIYTSNIINSLFNDVKYPSIKEQPNYIEIWAEKQGVIPENVAREFKATVRPAGGGEFSINMCYDAIKCAKQRKKNLFIFMLVDFDPKGEDMPKSVARKVELIAKQMGVIAFVEPIGLTEEQCIEHELPQIPAKTGGKAYETLTETWKKSRGRDPTELNSFMALKPEEYNETIRNAISPYYDSTLNEKIEKVIKEVKDDIKIELKKNIEKYREEIIKFQRIIKTKFEYLNKIINKKKEEIGIDKIVDDYKKLLKPNLKESLKGIKLEIPKADVSDPVNVLLDTRRNYLEQIDYYKDFDYRYKLIKGAKENGN